MRKNDRGGADRGADLGVGLGAGLDPGADFGVDLELTEDFRRELEGAPARGHGSRARWSDPFRASGKMHGGLPPAPTD